MAVWSNFLRSTNQKLSRFSILLLQKPSKNNQIRCMSHDRVMPIRSSDWQWTKCKDVFHFYFMLGAITVAVYQFCINVFIGPAQLQHIPEGYVPKHWEYYRAPGTRIMARYICRSHQQDYEKYLNVVYLEQELRKARMLQKRIEDLIKERSDYKFFYYVPITAKYLHQAKHDIEKNDIYRTYSK